MATRSPSAGGAPIALGAIGGAAIGFVRHQPTVWLLGGLAVGALIALLIWWWGR